MVQPIKLIAFVLVMMAYLWVPISTITQQEKILKNGTLYKFRPQPIDPYDAFRGRFIYANIPNPALPIPPEESKFTDGQKVYLALARDTAGYAYFEGLSNYKPQDRDYLQAQVQRVGEEKIWVDLPPSLQKYYLNEKLAPLAEARYNEILRSRRDTENPTAGVVLDVKIWKGKALMEKLYFNGQEAEAYLRLLKE